MNFRNILIFLVAFIGLIVFQREVVMPLVLEVVKSDLFLSDTDDIGSNYPVSDSMTNFANMHCNHYITDKLGKDLQVNFTEKPLNAWTLGNYTYLINSELSIVDTEGRPLIKKFVCRISYKPGSQIDGAPDYTNWSVYGLSGLDGI